VPITEIGIDVLTISVDRTVFNEDDKVPGHWSSARLTAHGGQWKISVPTILDGFLNACGAGGELVKRLMRSNSAVRKLVEHAATELITVVAATANTVAGGNSFEFDGVAYAAGPYRYGPVDVTAENDGIDDLVMVECGKEPLTRCPEAIPDVVTEQFPLAGVPVDASQNDLLSQDVPDSVGAFQAAVQPLLLFQTQDRTVGVVPRRAVVDHIATRVGIPVLAGIEHIHLRELPVVQSPIVRQIWTVRPRDAAQRGVLIERPVGDCTPTKRSCSSRTSTSRRSPGRST
jgi:hypothetical protein